MPKKKMNGQLDLFVNHTETSLKRYLEENIGKPVSLILTDNSSSLLSARIQDGEMRIRLHRLFMESSNQVIDEIVSYLKNKRSRMSHFHSFIREKREHIQKKPPKKIPVRTSGRFHDLRDLYNEINEEYFGGMIDAAITWGTRCARLRVGKRTLGSYSERSNTIRINPVLDKKVVPRYYVAFVVYHEMLHAATGILLQGKKRSLHSREFRKRERFFRDYEKAIAWERGTA